MTGIDVLEKLKQVSPDTEAVRAEARGLRQPLLVVDLRAAGQRERPDEHTEQQAGLLRKFLELS